MMIKAKYLLPLLAALSGPVAAQETVNMPDVVELSGAGAVSGINWKNGVTLATEEINAGKGILGRKIATTHYDTQSDPGNARAQMQKALDTNPYIVLGPIFSGSVKVNMMMAQAAGVPQFTGAEAADITQAGNPFIFRTSFGQQAAMPRVANYLRDSVKVKKIAVVWVNNDFGKGGHDSFVKEAIPRGMTISTDISTESGQPDFAADVVKIKNSGAEAIFIYENEEEAARLLKEIRKQGVKLPVIGDTNTLSQKVIELAGPAANGVSGFIGLSPDVPVKAVTEFRDKYFKRFNVLPDHNAVKGYMAVYTIKFVTEKIGSFDRAKFAKTMHGITIRPEDTPGILIETSWDNNGDIDRIGFLGQVENGKAVIVKTLPKLGK